MSNHSYPVYSAPMPPASKFIMTRIETTGLQNVSRRAVLTAPVELADREDKEKRRRDRKQVESVDAEQGEAVVENKWKLHDPASSKKFGGTAQRTDEQDFVLLVFDEVTNSFFVTQPENVHMKPEVISRWKTVEEAEAYMNQRNKLSSRTSTAKQFEDSESTSFSTPLLSNSASAILSSIQEKSRHDENRGSKLTLADLHRGEDDSTLERSKLPKSRIIKTDTEYARFDDDEGAIADYISDQELADEDAPKHRSFKQKMHERSSARKLGMEEYDADEVETEELAGKLSKKVVDIYESDFETSDGSSGDDMDDSIGSSDQKSSIVSKNARARHLMDATATDVEQELKKIKIKATDTASKVSKTHDINSLDAKLTREFLTQLFTQKASQSGFSVYDVTLSSTELFSAYWPSKKAAEVPKEDAAKFKVFIQKECNKSEKGDRNFFLRR